MENLTSSTTKFDRFYIHETSYRKVGTHNLAVHVLIPKLLKPDATNVPILVRIHGGYLITGAAMYAGFISDWVLDYCIQSNAILVSPDYRLLPESTGLDILSDIDSFWDWIEGGLSEFMVEIGQGGLLGSKAHERKVLVFGDSAGGYLAVQSILRRPGIAKALVASYPMIELDAPFFGEKYGGKSPFGAPPIDGAALEGHLKHIFTNESNDSQAVISQVTPPARIELALVMVQQGLLTQKLGEDESLFPLKVLKHVQLDEKPYVFVFHGTEDTAVPYEGTKKFVNLWIERFGDDTITASFLAGKDHGFDLEIALETDWLKAGLAKVTEAWLT